MKHTPSPVPPPPTSFPKQLHIPRLPFHSLLSFMAKHCKACLACPPLTSFLLFLTSACSRCVPYPGRCSHGPPCRVPAVSLWQQQQLVPWLCLWPFGLLRVLVVQHGASASCRPWHPVHVVEKKRHCGLLAFVEFLTDEIKEEKKIQKHKSLSKISGDWELEVNRTKAKLLGKVTGEKIIVTFNINNSISPTFDGEKRQKAEEEEPELTSTSNFVVEVKKSDGKKVLVLDCHYPDEIGRDEANISFQPRDSEWKDTTQLYTQRRLPGLVLEDSTSVDELVELSTALEHQEYITFLEDLKSFVKS
ncbi:hypothetical protein A6R68_19182, partial [Neotoma lepida]